MSKKEVGASIDSYHMRSTLINMDIEEMCHCLACALFQVLQQSQRQSMLIGFLQEFQKVFEEEVPF